MRALAIVLGAVLATAAFGSDVRFVREGVEVKTVDVPALMRACPVTTVEIDDPNYGARKHYRACRLADVFAFGFGAPPASLGSADVFIRAWDGYDKATSAARLA